MEESLRNDLVNTLEGLKDVVSNNVGAMTAINGMISRIHSAKATKPEMLSGRQDVPVVKAPGPDLPSRQAGKVDVKTPNVHPSR